MFCIITLNFLVTHNEFEIVQEVKGILKNSNRKTKKGREVVIVDSSGEPSTVAGSQKLRKTGNYFL